MNVWRLLNFCYGLASGMPHTWFFMCIWIIVWFFIFFFKQVPQNIYINSGCVVIVSLELIKILKHFMDTMTSCRNKTFHANLLDFDVQWAWIDVINYHFCFQSTWGDSIVSLSAMKLKWGNVTFIYCSRALSIMVQILSCRIGSEKISSQL